MGWTPSALGKEEYLILSTQGGIAQKMASPIAFPVIFNFWNDRYHAPTLVTNHLKPGVIMELTG